MIHAQQIAHEPRISNPRRAKGATASRMKAHQRARYSTIVRFSLVLLLGFGFVMAYVTLTANLTSLSYRLAAANAQKATLLDEDARLDDRLTSLQSDERLAHIAAGLGMHPAQGVAVLHLEAPKVAMQKSVPLVAAISGWFKPHKPTVR